MGLFGFNAEKKLKKAEEHLSRSLYYEARQGFEEIIMRDGVNPTLVSRARDGWRRSRRGLMEGLIEEAKHAIDAGEVETARESCEAALEQAGEDLKADEAREMLERLGGGQQSESAQLLSGLDDVQSAHQLPAEQAELEEEAAGEGPEAMFEVLLMPLPESQAEKLRTFGEIFRDGYILLQDGQAKPALEKFAQVSETVAGDPFFRVEKSQAFMFAEQDQEAFDALEGVELPADHGRRVTEMRSVLLQRLKRGEEALAEARTLWETDREDREAAVLYAELLLDNEKAEAAEEVIEPFHGGPMDPEVDSLLVRAQLEVGKATEARHFLEATVEGFFQSPGAYRRGFPVWAAAMLLDVYIKVGENPKEVRSLVQHLISHYPDGAEQFKAKLAEYVEGSVKEGEGAGES